MPVYEMKLPGQDKPRMIKAKDVSTALTGVVEIKAIGAERMLELQDQGVALEKAADPTDPAAHAPGGPLHDKTGGHGDQDKPEGGDKPEGDKPAGSGKDGGKPKE